MTEENKGQEIYNFVKNNIGILGKVSYGTGFSLSKRKLSPYLKLSFLDTNLIDLGPFITALGEGGVALGIKISEKKDKNGKSTSKIFLDAGISTDLIDLVKNNGVKLGVFGGFRLKF